MARGDLKATAFPALSDEQIDELGKFAESRTFADGQPLIEEGQKDFKFYVVKRGTVEIVENSVGQRKVITVHGPKEFTGDVDMLTGRSSVVAAVARGDCELLEISAEELRRLVSERPALGDEILRAFIARRVMLEASGFIGCRVIGSRYSADTFRIRDFLARNRIPFTWVDLESDPHVGELLAYFQVCEADTPVVACGESLLMRRPSNRDLAERLGITKAPEDTLYDLAIVGAGPGGLAAAVYGASEGLKTIVLEEMAPGGQAGCSSKIENYLGFPTGLSGADLAGRAVLQAHKFGAQVTVPAKVVGMEARGPYQVLHLERGERVEAKCVLIATGAEYRKVEIEGRDKYEGNGVYYAATGTEAQLCGECPVAIIGGGNSAGQAAVFLAEHAKKVWLLIRGDDLSQSMSQYLSRRIDQTANIELLRRTEVRRIVGDEERPTALHVVNNQTGQTATIDARAVFLFTGATPRTDWLPEAIETDEKGFVKTGRAVANSPKWTGHRAPFLLETSRPGVFAAGDVRLGSTKRVAAAVGEGSMVVQFVHEYLRDQ